MRVGGGHWDAATLDAGSRTRGTGSVGAGGAGSQALGRGDRGRRSWVAWRGRAGHRHAATAGHPALARAGAWVGSQGRNDCWRPWTRVRAWCCAGGRPGAGRGRGRGFADDLRSDDLSDTKLMRNVGERGRRKRGRTGLRWEEEGEAERERNARRETQRGREKGKVAAPKDLFNFSLTSMPPFDVYKTFI
ncbi:hypothetical protein Taro_008141 [Colocasia esculenta]|uniref:Uncharacterized protein n=1 Tax=Colocasia esculenta TaxID=4460 RepID=A0A843U2H3_COLES|nr:hypothetical protein [Colocasia esculenta]